MGSLGDLMVAGEIPSFMPFYVFLTRDRFGKTSSFNSFIFEI
jgi:hypothetical protein